MALLAGRNNGVKGPAPGAAKNINRSGRIRASGYGPDNFVQICDVYVFVYDYHVPTQVSPGMTLAGD